MSFRIKLLFKIGALFVCWQTCKADSMGFDISYFTKDGVSVEGYYYPNKYKYQIGITYQNTEAVGKEVSERKPNYGRKVSGTGDYFRSFDIGFGYKITPKLMSNIELSIGVRNYYTNYIDHRFTDNGYHMIDESKYVHGLGANISYLLLPHIGVVTGFNTIRQFSLGVRFSY